MHVIAHSVAQYHAFAAGAFSGQRQHGCTIRGRYIGGLACIWEPRPVSAPPGIRPASTVITKYTNIHPQVAVECCPLTYIHKWPLKTQRANFRVPKGSPVSFLRCSVPLDSVAPFAANTYVNGKTPPQVETQADTVSSLG